MTRARRYNPDRTLDPSFSRNSRQRTDFGSRDRPGVAIQADGKTSRLAPAEGTSRSPATADGRSTRALRNSRQRTDFGSDRANGVAIQATARSSRSASLAATPATTARPLNRTAPRWTSPATASRRRTSAGSPTTRQGCGDQTDGKILASARHLRGVHAGAGPLQPIGCFSRGRQGDDRQGPDRANRAAINRTARSSRSARWGGPTDDDFGVCSQPERLTRPELPGTAVSGPTSRLRARQRRVDPGGQQDRRGGPRRPGRDWPRLPRALQRTDRSTRAFGVGREPMGAGTRNGWRSKRTARSWRSGAASEPMEPPISRSLATWEGEPPSARLAPPSGAVGG